MPARARVTIEILGKDDQVEKKHGFLVDDMVTPQQAGEMVTRTIELANRKVDGRWTIG